jgi:hypothetical protein
LTGDDVEKGQKAVTATKGGEAEKAAKMPAVPVKAKLDETKRPTQYAGKCFQLPSHEGFLILTKIVLDGYTQAKKTVSQAKRTVSRGFVAALKQDRKTNETSIRHMLVTFLRKKKLGATVMNTADYCAWSVIEESPLEPLCEKLPERGRFWAVEIVSPILNARDDWEKDVETVWQRALGNAMR